MTIWGPDGKGVAGGANADQPCDAKMTLWAEIRFAWTFLTEIVRYPTLVSSISYDTETGEIIVKRTPR